MNTDFSRKDVKGGCSMLALVKKKFSSMVDMFCNRTRKLFPDLRSDIRKGGDLSKLFRGEWYPSEVSGRTSPARLNT